MGSKYPVLKPSEVIITLEKLGFTYKSQKGSHVKYIKTAENQQTKTVIIPMHTEVAKGTLQSILEQAGITLNDFLKHLS
jgi:predicted RNA binding protein YcfA (HicA-like mRNA interferase family)